MPILSVLLLLLATGFASAATVIRNDHGGVIREYAARFAAIGHRHERLVIDGACFSACTMALSVPGMCVMPRAKTWRSTRQFRPPARLISWPIIRARFAAGLPHGAASGEGC